MTSLLNGVSPLGHLGVIAAAGEDAASFLQGQLTNDVVLLPVGQARLAAWCSPKGRMLASFIVVKRSADDLLLVTSRDVLPATLKRLSMFVLRSKCKLRDATAEFALHGLAGEAAAAAPGNPWQASEAGGAFTVRLPAADSVGRALRIAPQGTGEPAGPSLEPSVWAWGEVRSGVATITAPVSEAFVPQMLNYESVEGVNFKKGCYPGQEVVARSQFRGTLKRRAFLAHAAGPLSVGQEVFTAADPSQPCGLVAQAAPAPQGGFDAIVSMQVSARGEPLQAGGPQGLALVVADPPYPLLADV
jgi:folate-binding protein YgfZ